MKKSETTPKYLMKKIRKQGCRNRADYLKLWCQDYNNYEPERLIVLFVNIDGSVVCVHPNFEGSFMSGTGFGTCEYRRCSEYKDFRETWK
jgi:hypothetical protein